MPLRVATPPPGAYDLVAQAVASVSTAGGAASAVVAVRDPARLNATIPHRVYSLTSPQISSGQNVNRARFLAWRFLIQDGSRVVAAVELAGDAQGRNLRFASLESGPFVQGTRNAVTMAEGLDTVRASNFELRVLKLASVYAMALWLKNLDGGEDLIIPIQPAGAVGTQPATEGGSMPQPPRSFLQSLQEVARVTLDNNDAPIPGPGNSGGGMGGASPMPGSPPYPRRPS